MRMSRICKCKEFKPNIKRLDGVISFSTAYWGPAKQLGENYVFFKYCPWCGKKLEEIKE